MSRKPLQFSIDRSPTPPKGVANANTSTETGKKQVGARISDSLYRQLKARAAMEGEKVQTLVEKAISQFLAVETRSK